jgi:hypothetical protein
MDYIRIMVFELRHAYNLRYFEEFYIFEIFMKNLKTEV